MPELYLSCSQGGYNREFLTAVIREHAAVDASGGAAGPRAAGGRSKGRAGKAAGERQKSRMKAAGDVVEVDVPGILDHEVVVVELA